MAAWLVARGNKEDGNYRPHYLAIQDSQNSGIYWMIPVSSKFEKYQNIYSHQVARYKKCTKIVLGKCGGRDAAFLIQNAFPTTADYFDHIHTSKGIPLSLHSSTAKLIADGRKIKGRKLTSAISTLPFEINLCPVVLQVQRMKMNRSCSRSTYH